MEEGIISGKLIKQIARLYLAELDNKIDTLILGCTHYPLLKEPINELYPDLEIVDPARETAYDLKEILIKEKLLKNDAEKGKEVQYFVTDSSEKFKEIGTMFLEEMIEAVKVVKL